MTSVFTIEKITGRRITAALTITLEGSQEQCHRD